MTLRRRTLAASALVILAGAALVYGPAGAQSPGQPPTAFPKGTVRIVVPFPPGGPADAVGRVLAQRLQDVWKSPVIVENRPGASGTIGAHSVAQAAPDGHTLLISAGATNGAAEVLNPKTTPYRTMRDFSMVGFIGVSPTLMVVSTQAPATTVKEFVELAKANPGKYSYANASAGSAPSFAFELLKQITSADILQVPFNGAAPALAALNGGHVSAYMGSVFSVLPSLQAGKARAVGAASSRRIEGYPDVPTLTEQGYPVAWDTWYGVLAPAAVPAPLLDKLNADLRAALDGEEVRQVLARQGLERRLGTRDQMREAVEKEIADAIRVGTAAKMIQN